MPLFDVTDCPVFSGPFGHVHKALYPGLFGIAWNIPCHMSRSEKKITATFPASALSISCQPASKDPHLGTNGNNTRLVIHASSRMWIYSAGSWRSIWPGHLRANHAHSFPSVPIYHSYDSHPFPYTIKAPYHTWSNSSGFKWCDSLVAYRCSARRWSMITWGTGPDQWSEERWKSRSESGIHPDESWFTCWYYMYIYYILYSII